MNHFTKQQYAAIFKAAEATIFNDSSLKNSDLKKFFKPFKELKVTSREDNDYFWILVRVAFYAGFRAKTINEKIDSIKEYFGDYSTVAKYDDAQVKKIIDSKRVIGNRNKISAVIYNAKQIFAVQKEFGSVDNYINSFGNHDDDDKFFTMVADLRKRFHYLGEITVFHFLLELGFNVVKPDRVLCRIYHRLGIIDRENDYIGVVKAGRRIAAAANEPIRYVDLIFVIYGQVGEKRGIGLSDGICLSTNPRCQICGLYNYCNYEKKLPRNH